MKELFDELNQTGQMELLENDLRLNFLNDFISDFKKCADRATLKSKIAMLAQQSHDFKMKLLTPVESVAFHDLTTKMELVYKELQKKPKTVTILSEVVKEMQEF